MFTNVSSILDNNVLTMSQQFIFAAFPCNPEIWTQRNCRLQFRKNTPVNYRVPILAYRCRWTFNSRFVVPVLVAHRRCVIVSDIQSARPANVLTFQQIRFRAGDDLLSNSNRSPQKRISQLGPRVISRWPIKRITSNRSVPSQAWIQLYWMYIYIYRQGVSALFAISTSIFPKKLQNLLAWQIYLFFFQIRNWIWKKFFQSLMHA